MLFQHLLKIEIKGINKNRANCVCLCARVCIYDCAHVIVLPRERGYCEDGGLSTHTIMKLTQCGTFNLSL